jgi:hypothetical protein
MVKMSDSDNKSVSEIVDKCWRDFPQYHNPEKRTELFRLIKSKLDKKDSANIRAVHRALRKLYDEDSRLKSKLEELSIKINKLSSENYKLSVVDTYLKISEIVETDEDYQDLNELLERLRIRKLGREQKEDNEDKQKILGKK